jgi:O-antigen/teichoic acid export membrane protein
LPEKQMPTPADSGMSESRSVTVADVVASSRREQLTSGPRLARNAVWNLIGNVAPLLVAFFSIPLLIKGLGTDRFGVLTLVWALIGYASLFDLGLGRALTQLVAAKLGNEEDVKIPALVWTSLILMFLLGLVGAVVLVILAPWLVHRALHVPGSIGRETLAAVYLLGISIPFLVSTAALRGLLEAYQRFGLTTALRLPMGILTFVGPLLVLPVSRSLVPVVGVLIVIRAITWAAHLVLCLKTLPMLRLRIAWETSAVRPLFQFGTWMTVSNIVGAVIVTLDRFLIGSLLSVSAVAYYATPYEVMSKFWIIPNSLLGVMFPAFSTNFFRDRNRTALLYRLTVKCLVVLLFPVILLVVVLASDGLKLWLGPEFARQSTPVLQWLAAGMFINCLASVPFAAVQSSGKPDLTAKLHLIELPAYVAMLFWLTKTHGIEGAAIAWTVRSLLDAVVLFGLANWLLPGKSSIRLQMPILVGTILVVFVVASLTRGLALKSVFILTVLLCFFAVIRFVVLSPEERNLARGLSHCP